MADWYVGQKVVCVHHFVMQREGDDVTYPVVGCIYTIRGIRDDNFETIGFLLEEIVNEERLGAHGDGSLHVEEPIFVEIRFRPVVNQSTDISVFTSILDKVNKREVVDA